MSEKNTLPDEHIKRVLIAADEITTAVAAAGKRISEDETYSDGKPLLLVGILKGSFVFLADLCRSITLPCEIAFMAAKSYYGGTKSVGNVEITLDISQNLSGCHVVIVEDIIDSGRTLSEVARLLRGRSPLSLKVVTLLDKPSRREVDFNADLSLFTIDDLFVVGYGLDCAEKYRNLPYIAEYTT